MKKLMPVLLAALLAGCAGKAAVEPNAPEAKAEETFPITIAWKTAPQAGIKCFAMPDITFTVKEGSAPGNAIDVQVVFDTDVQKPTTRRPGTVGITSTPGGPETSEVYTVTNLAKPDMTVARIRCMQVVSAGGSGEIKEMTLRIPVGMFLANNSRPDTNLLFPADVTTPTFRVALFKARPGVNAGGKLSQEVQLSNWITVQLDPNPYQTAK